MSVTLLKEHFYTPGYHPSSTSCNYICKIQVFDCMKLLMHVDIIKLVVDCRIIEKISWSLGVVEKKLIFTFIFH